jgi:hypothetical protein
MEPPRPLANTSDWAAPEVKIVVGCMVTYRVVLLKLVVWNVDREQGAVPVITSTGADDPFNGTE